MSLTPFIFSSSCVCYLVFEGLFVSQFDGDSTPLIASPGSPFFISLGCTADTQVCTGTVSQCKSFHNDTPDEHLVCSHSHCTSSVIVGMESSFPDFTTDNIKWSIIYLITLLIVSRVVTFIALTKLDYRAT